MINAFIEPVQEGLTSVESKMRAQANGHNPDLAAALAHLLSSGGKRIRPALTLLTAKMLGADPQRAVTLASAIEMLHTATLVHDDLIDGALIRRGIPTLNARWSPAATVLTGDFVFARAAKLAAETDSVEVMHLFADTLATIVNGELTQLFASRGIASREDYNRRIYAKTASLFETATSAAAIIASASLDTINKLRCYGYEIGMAFQIVDDILDFTGEQTTIGKPVASDLRQGLITLPALHYLEAFPDDIAMQAILSGSECDNHCMETLVTAIRDSGAVRKALDEAREYVRRGISCLADLPERPEKRNLIDLAEYIVSRDL